MWIEKLARELNRHASALAELDLEIGDTRDRLAALEQLRLAILQADVLVPKAPMAPSASAPPEPKPKPATSKAPRANNFTPNPETQKIRQQVLKHVALNGPTACPSPSQIAFNLTLETQAVDNALRKSGWFAKEEDGWHLTPAGNLKWQELKEQDRV